MFQMSIVPDFSGSPEPRRDRPAQTSGFETFDEMIMAALIFGRLRSIGAFDEVVKLLAEDCEMVCPSPAGHSPFHGNYAGRDEVIAALRESFAVVQFSGIEPISIAGEGDTVVANWHAMAHGRGVAPIRVEGMAQMRFRNRLIYHYQNHSDTASMVAMSGFRQEDIDG